MKKTRGFRILLAYLLAGVMIFSAVPVWAEEPAGDGTAEEAPACATLIRVEDGVVYVYDTESGEWVQDDDLTANLTLDGDLTTDVVVNLFPGDGILLAPALEVTSNEEDTSFTVKGTVTMENEEGDTGDRLTAVEVGGEGHETTLTVTEDIVAAADITAPEPDNTEPAEGDDSGEEPEAVLDTSANEAMLALEVWASDGSEDGSEDESEGESEENGEETLTKVEVQGSVIAEVSAEGEDYAGAQADTMRVYSSGEDAKAEVVVEEDAIATAVASDRGEDGEQHERADATVIHTDGDGNTEITIKGDAVATAEAPNGNANATVVDANIYGGETTIQIEGNATAAIVGNEVYEMEEEPQGAITILAENSGGTLTVDVDQKIEAISNVPGDAPVAVSVSSWGEESLTQVTAGEGVEGQILAQAVEGGQTVIVVEDGGVTAETGALLYHPWDYQSESESAEETERGAISEGIHITAEGGGVAQITVIGDTQVTNSEDIPEADGVGLYVEDADSEIIACFEGNVSAELKEEVSDTEVKTETVAMTLENAGDMKVAVEGDVTATCAQDNFGIYVEAAEGADTDILVDGTVSAEDGAIVLSGETTKIGENVTLTVWKLEPDEDGDLVVLGTRDEETGRITAAPDGEAGQGAKEAEKRIQYIIRVDASQTELIQTTGTRQYTGANGKTYDVANEGDNILVKLNIPEGYVIDGVFWDEDQAQAIVEDNNGDYYLSVPRGGGVVLSVKLKEEEKQDDPVKQDESASKSDDESGKALEQPKQNESAPKSQNTEKAGSVVRPAAAPVKEVLKIRDDTGTVEMVFYSNGTYRVNFPEGEPESGKFRLENGEIVLTRDNNPKTSVDYDQVAKRYCIQFDIVTDDGECVPLMFGLTEDDVKLLKQVFGVT